MTVVYRVQDREGRGPWRPGFSHRWVEARPDHDNLLPWMSQFNAGLIFAEARGFLGCGCRDIEQLQRWFTRAEYARLITFGYRCVRMTVDRVLAESDIQLVFERSTLLHRDVKRTALYTSAIA